MKTLGYCWSCNKEHDLTDIGIKEHGLKCECGGFVISPSGKIKSKLVPENNNDKKLLGIQVEKTSVESVMETMPKVYRMDDYSWVCAMSEEEAIAWYVESTGATEEDLEIKECDIDKNTMFTEIELLEIVSKLEKMNDYDDQVIEITKRHGDYFIKETFKEVIQDMINKSTYESIILYPFEICTTEW